MTAYYDTGALVPLYVEEVFSDPINAFIKGRSEVVPFHLFHRLEWENALRLKTFRGEIEEDCCGAVLDKIAANIREGRLVARPVNWVSAMEEARRMGAKVTARTGCRSLDLLHVAIAVQWESAVFVTADDRQLKAARSVGLRTVDVRTLPRGHWSSGEPPAAPRGIVREPRARYGAKKKPRALRQPRMEPA